MGEEIVEGFGERGVGEDGVTERCVGELGPSWRSAMSHDFAAFEAEDRGTEDLAGAGVDNGFHEAAGFRRVERPGDVFMGILATRMDRSCARASASVRPMRPSCGFDEDGVGDQTIDGGGVPFSIRLVRGGCGNRRRKYGLKAGPPLMSPRAKMYFAEAFEPFVDADEAVVVGRDRGGGEIQRVGIGERVRWRRGDACLRPFAIFRQCES